MTVLIKQFFSRPLFAVELLAVTLCIHLLGLASSVYVIQVLNRYVSHGLDSTLVTLTAGVILAVVMEFGFRQARMKLAQGVTVRPDYQLGVRLFERVIATRAGSIDHLGAAAQREIVASPGVVGRSHGPANLVALLDVPFALVFVGVLFLLQPPLGWVASGFLSLAFLVSILGHPFLRGLLREHAQASSEAGALSGSVMRAVDAVRAFNAGDLLRSRFRSRYSASIHFQRRVESRRELIQTATQSLGALMSVFVIAEGARLVVAGEMDVGLLIGANILAARAMAPILRFAQLGAALAEARRAMETLGAFSRLPLERSGGAQVKQFSGRLELKEIAFAHEDGSDPLFEALTLTLAPGASLVVSGANGTGKTTLARILMGLLEPTRGQILVDGVNLDQLALSWWRRQVVYLPQEPSFVEGTIRDNLTTLQPEWSDEAMNAAIAEAGLARFLHDSPQGLDTPLVNGGTHLAMGIRKRLALARALGGECRIAVFDEPLEGMDLPGREAVTAVLSRMARTGRTVIVFSHDATLIRGADLVLNLDRKPVPELRIKAARTPEVTA
ncbi:MAG: ATP-binding cassette domain-containing protein [Magnetococcales bacterium]|nr:ATP-binding cassette domain-containing protein [Magnetococcales bacterium]